jgi:nucleoside-diphosphate-sugar epimerase
VSAFTTTEQLYLLSSVSKRIAVIGASGVAGRAFVPLALEAGFNVRTTRADVFDPLALREFFSGCDFVVNLASSVPRKIDRNQGAAMWSRNDQIRREGVRNVVAACEAIGVPTLVQQSIAILNCDGPYASAREMEAYLNSVNMDCRIVRGALFYGPGTGLEERLETELATQTALANKAQVDCRENWLSTVHVDDFASAILAVLQCGQPSGLYIAADDEPLQWKDVYLKAANYFGLPSPPIAGGQYWPNLKTSNTGLCELGWFPRNKFLAAENNA